MKKLLFLLLMGIVAATGFSQITDASYYQRKQLGPGANWLFDYDTVRINRLHIENRTGFDSLGRMFYYNNVVPATGSFLKGNGTYFDNFARGSAAQVLRVNAGGTDLEWWTPTLGPTSITGLTPGLITFGSAGGGLEQSASLYFLTAGSGQFYVGSPSYFEGADMIIGAVGGNETVFDGVGRITKVDGLTIGQGQILKGSSGSTVNALTLGGATQLLRVNSGGTDIEWYDPKFTGLVVAPLDLTAQTASIAATTVYTTPAVDGWYRVSITGTVTTAAGTSLDLATQLRWTEATDNVVKSYPGNNVNNMNRTQTNTTAAGVVAITAICHVKASTAIQYLTTFSFSGGAPQYNLHVTVEKLAF